MTREQAKTLLQRVTDLEGAIFSRLRAEILIPYFGGNGCRLHNCLVNFQSGVSEWPVAGKNHAELAALARRWNHETEKTWRQCQRLREAFGKAFLK